MSQKFYCRYCGTSSSGVSSLTSSNCQRHPNGPFKGKHVLYEGSEKSQYTCKYCGTHASSISSLTSSSCQRHPDGSFKGHHEPAL
jgi:5-methylcytosine-specific restriction endonuclease McrA